MGFWPGGDRDGNPFVKADITLQVAGALRSAIIKCYYTDVRKLKRRLTFKDVDIALAKLEKRLYNNLFIPDYQFDLTRDEIIIALNEIATQIPGAPTVGTVGTLNVFPASRNIIPEEVTLTIDLRDIDLERRHQYEKQLKEKIELITKKHGLTYSLTLDPNSTASLTATSVWSTPVNHWGNTNAYLTSSKYYTIGTQNFGGLKGSVSFRKIHGIVNVHFQIYRSSDSSPITGNAFISIADIYSDIGYIPNQIVLLHTENSTQYFPALLENYAIQIPQTSLNAMSTMYYTYGEVQGYTNWKKPYLP